MIQIDFFDSDVLNTLVPIHTMSPDKVYFLADKKNFIDKQIANATKAIQSWKAETKIFCKKVNVDDIKEIQAVLDEIKCEADGEEICVDLTGGTELMSVCGYEFCKKYDARLIYMDAKREYIMDVFRGERLCAVRHILVNDYITAIGAKRLQDSHDLPMPEEYDNICCMAEILFEHIEAWHELSQMLAKQCKDTGGHMEAYIPPKYQQSKYKNVLMLAESFEQYGFWKKVDHATYRYKNHRFQDYMINYGIWLEMYIYIKAREVFEESILGLILDWNGMDIKDTEDNEIDVIVMKKSIPIFISCKMRKPEAADVYEVGYLSHRLGGIRAKACLATTFPVRDYGNTPKGIFQRFKKMRIGVIETQDFRKRKSCEVFNQAIQGTE